MSARFVINTLDFVRNAETRQADVAPAEFERLQSYLFDSEGVLAFTVCGRLDQASRPRLHVSVKGKLNLCCQRCLGKLEQQVNFQVDFLLVKNEAELHQYDEDDAIDTILNTPEIDLMMLIEDEIILELPISPCHTQGQCSEERSIGNNKIVNQDTPEHPFAALAAFKKLH